MEGALELANDKTYVKCSRSPGRHGDPGRSLGRSVTDFLFFFTFYFRFSFYTFCFSLFTFSSAVLSLFFPLCEVCLSFTFQGFKMNLSCLHSLSLRKQTFLLAHRRWGFPAYHFLITFCYDFIFWLFYFFRLLVFIFNLFIFVLKFLLFIN